MNKLLIPFLLALSIVADALRAAQADFEFQAAVPRVISLQSPGGQGVPPLTMSFRYDAKGKILLNSGAMAGTEPITGTATVGKLVKGVRSYTVTAKGTTLKKLSFTIKGDVGKTYATCKYSGPNGRVTLTNLPIALEVVSPVMIHFSLTSQLDARGKISGSGKIESGFGNDSTVPAVLTGSSNKTSLSWQLKQGTQRLSFAGKKGTNCFYGTLVATIPPASGSYKSFIFEGFEGKPTGGSTKFRGSISEGATSVGLPTAASGATITVSSDLNKNGTIEPSERFTATADQDGKYSLSCAVVDGGRALVEVNQSGFATQLKVLDPVRAGAEIVNNLTLRPLSEMTVTSTGATAPDGKLELINLPAEVSEVKARVFNPATEAEQFPGEFADDRGSLLVSSVFTAIEARDSNGAEVTDLGSGSTLRLQVPKDTWSTLRDLRNGTGQIDCPLYYYDEATGQWKRSNQDGWLEDAQGLKIPEARLAELREGTYDGKVYVVGPITHLSYWNLDWPVETHACITGVVVDSSGNPVAGATVTVRGATYTGSTSPKVTGPDGRFCADLMRSELAGEDVDGNGRNGETHQVNISVSWQGQLYNFGPYNNPTAQATCGNGGCTELSPLRLGQANLLTVGLCTITGTARFADDGAPVPNASVFAYDELLESDVFFQFLTNPAVRFFATTDANGAFSLTVPTLSGPTIVAAYSHAVGANTQESGQGMVQAAGCPATPVSLQVERYRNTAILDSAGEHVGSFFQHGSEVGGYVYLSVGNKLYWAVPPEDQPFQLPSQPGASVTWSLHTVDAGGADTVIGTIVFTATTAIGGTWQSTGVSLNGTWGN